MRGLHVVQINGVNHMATMKDVHNVDDFYRLLDFEELCHMHNHDIMTEAQFNDYISDTMADDLQKWILTGIKPNSSCDICINIARKLKERDKK